MWVLRVFPVLLSLDLPLSRSPSLSISLSLFLSLWFFSFVFSLGVFPVRLSLDLPNPKEALYLPTLSHLFDSIVNKLLPLSISLSLSLSLCVCLCMCLYVTSWLERGRNRERGRKREGGREEGREGGRGGEREERHLGDHELELLAQFSGHSLCVCARAFVSQCSKRTHSLDKTFYVCACESQCSKRTHSIENTFYVCVCGVCACERGQTHLIFCVLGAGGWCAFGCLSLSLCVSTYNKYIKQNQPPTCGLFITYLFK